MPNDSDIPQVGPMQRLKRLSITLVVFGLTACILFLLAERNRRFYFLSSIDGKVVVERGAWLPYGKEPFEPEEDSLAEAYAPISIPEGVGGFASQRFEERPDLDRALFDVLAGWAEPRVRAGDGLEMKEGLVLVNRAALLPGIRPDQRGRLRGLQAELAWYEGKQRLDDAGKLILEARRQLELATEASPGRAREAVAILDDLIPAADRLNRALQTARGLRFPMGYPPPQEEEPRKPGDEAMVVSGQGASAAPGAGTAAGAGAAGAGSVGVGTAGVGTAGTGTAGAVETTTEGGKGGLRPIPARATSPAPSGSVDAPGLEHPGQIAPSPGDPKHEAAGGVHP